jgi:F-type H+-transporting ATPase subunit b
MLALRMNRLLLAAGTALVMLPTLVLAADEAVGAIPTVKQGLATGITAIVVFLVTAAFLGAVVWPKISQGLDDRANKIKDEIEAAEQARKQAKDALEEYQKSLAQARAEAAKMIEATKAQQNQLAAELKAKSEIELNAMRERAMKEIDQAKRAAVSELYADATNLATMVAGKILKREINAQDQQRLVEESLGQLQSLRN